MFAIFVVAGLAILALSGMLIVGLLALVFKFAVRLILLPLLLVKWIIAAVMMLVVGPILLVVGALVAAALAIALALPLLPFIAVAAVIWLIVRSTRRPVTA